MRLLWSPQLGCLGAHPGQPISCRPRPGARKRACDDEHVNLWTTSRLTMWESETAAPAATSRAASASCTARAFAAPVTATTTPCIASSESGIGSIGFTRVDTASNGTPERRRRKNLAASSGDSPSRKESIAAVSRRCWSSRVVGALVACGSISGLCCSSTVVQYPKSATGRTCTAEPIHQ